MVRQLLLGNWGNCAWAVAAMLDQSGAAVYWACGRATTPHARKNSPNSTNLDLTSGIGLNPAIG
jgi:hypothetical protein